MFTSTCRLENTKVCDDSEGAGTFLMEHMPKSTQGRVFFEIFEKYLVLFLIKNQRILWKKEGAGVFRENFIISFAEGVFWENFVQKYPGTFSYFIRKGSAKFS